MQVQVPLGLSEDYTTHMRELCDKWSGLLQCKLLHSRKFFQESAQLKFGAPIRLTFDKKF